MLKNFFWLFLVTLLARTASGDPGDLVDWCKFAGFSEPYWNTPASSIPGMGLFNGIETPEVPYMSPIIDPNGVKVFKLYAQRLEHIVFYNTSDRFKIIEAIPQAIRLSWPDDDPPSILFKGWGINGNDPGPTLVVRKGDNLRIEFHNELPIPTSLHFHGVELPYQMDGAAGVNSPVIHPGESYNYSFPMTQCGTFMYHFGHQPWLQNVWGMGGVLISKCEEEPRADRDFSFYMQSKVFTIPGTDGESCLRMGFNPALTWHSFNGKVSPSHKPILLRQGQIVRFRFASVDNAFFHPIHIHGHTWSYVAQQGTINPRPFQRGNTFSIGPGQTQDVMFVAKQGIWPLHCHIMFHINNALLKYIDDPTQANRLAGHMTFFLCVSGPDFQCPGDWTYSPLPADPPHFYSEYSSTDSDSDSESSSSHSEHSQHQHNNHFTSTTQ